MLSPGLDARERTIELDVNAGPDTRAPKLLEDANKGPEGILLLEGGRLLVVKQKDPVLLIEFGPPQDGNSTFEPCGHLALLDRFELPADRDGELVPLHSWLLLDEDGDGLESANDLAVDGEGNLNVLSSHSRSIYELPARSSEGGEMMAEGRWRLPDEMGLSPDRRAEGLTFDGQGRPVVAIDARDEHENLFLLKRLRR